MQAKWDTQGRLIRLSSGTSVLEEYIYDTAEQKALGKLAEVTYPGGKQSFIYDSSGHLTQRIYHYDGEAKSYSLRYEYNTLGRASAIIHTDGTRIEQQLTFNGWLKSITNVIQNIQYNSRGLPTEITYNNGVTTNYDYTPGPGRIRTQTTISPSPQNDIFEDVEYTFDKMEVIRSYNDKSPDGIGLRLFNYDPLYQLNNVSMGENGNMIQRKYDYKNDYNLSSNEEIKTTLLYDDPIHPDRTTGIITDDGPQFTLDYDGNGNMLNLPDQKLHATMPKMN